MSNFNKFYNRNDKNGGTRVNYERLRRFNEFCLRNKFENIICKRKKYIWKGKYRDGIIYEKLDKGLVREDWMILYLNVY